MTDLRQFAEMIPLGIDEYHQADWSKAIATLLNAMVEERANLRICQFRNTAYRVDLKLIPSPTGHYEKREWTDDDWRTQALHELNLKGV